MEEMMMVDVYQIRASYALSSTRVNVLMQLYQPLIGYSSISLYLTLSSEMNQVTLTKEPSLISRLIKVSGLSLKELKQSLRKLEAVGLLQSYEKKGQNHRYLFDLQLPMTPYQFFHHDILNTLLHHKLGQEEYQKTLMNFKIFDVNKEDYQNITHRFQDVFDISLLDDHFVLKDHGYQDVHVADVGFEFDFDLFYQGLDNLQLSKKMLSDDDEILIGQLGYLYKIDALSMQNLVKESMYQNTLNQQTLKEKCQFYFDTKIPDKLQDVYHLQSLKHQDQTDESEKGQYLHYLQTVSPYQFLKDFQGGREPLKRDLQVIEAVLTTLQLEPGVMNVLIDLTLDQCDMTLSRNFMESQGARWKRKKIETVQQALDEGKAYVKYRQSHSDTIIYPSDNNEQSGEMKNDINDKIDEDVLEILSKYD